MTCCTSAVNRSASIQGAKNGTAEVDVHIPIARVQDAIARFSTLGLIVGQHVSVADLQSLSGLQDYGTFAWTKQPTPQIVTSAAEAASVSGLRLPIVGTLPSGVSSTVTYAAMPQAVGVFKFDAAKAQAARA